MKKVLAWAVALALVLSSFTMAFAADTGKTSKDFSDADQIQYTEAVDVMVATGIINGFPDGTFGPQKTVTRSQMAKMIACIKNGGEDVGDQYKSACPFKDSQKHWAAGYIAYCASEHIIDGRSADVFDPDADVTGTEVAKMALTTLGYDSKIQGYTGETWAAAVLKDAKKVGLFEGLDKSFVPGDPCSREAAAQILFNMLKAVEVEYTNGTSVAIGDDISVVVASDIKEQTWPVDKTTTPPTYDKNDDTKDGLKQLYEDVFGGKLSQNKTAADKFGDPSHSWTYPDKKTEVGNYVTASDYEFIAEDATFAKALKAYDEALAEDYSATPTPKLIVKSVTINGGDGTEAAIGTGDKVKMFAATAPATGAVEGATYYDVVVEQYKAVRINNVSTNVKSADAKNGVKAYVYLKGDNKKYTDKEIPGFDAETYVKDAVIATATKSVTKDGTTTKTIIDSYVMDELVSGKVSAIDTKTGTATIDAKDYQKATNYADDTLVAGDNEYTLYDYNGYYLAADQTAAAPEDVYYGVLLASGEQAATFGGTPVVKIFTSEGKEEVIEYSCALPETKTYQDNNASDDVMIKYTLDEDGVIKTMAKPKPDDTFGTDGAKVGTNNVLAGKFVTEETVVFLNEAEEPATGSNTPKASKYAIYGLSDLVEASAVKGSYFTNAVNDTTPGDTYTAILLIAPLQAPEKTESILGFVTNVNEKSVSGGKYVYTVEALANGEEVTYTSIELAKKDWAPTTATKPTLVEFKLDGDKKLTDIASLGTIKKVGDLDEANHDFTDTDMIAQFAKNGVTGEVKAVLNKALDMEGNKNFQVVDGAYVYEIIYDSTAKTYTVELSDVDSIQASNEVINVTADLYQTVKGTDHWNIVVYQVTEE